MQRGGLALAFTLMISLPALAAEPAADHAQPNPQANPQANPQVQENAQEHPEGQQHPQEQHPQDQHSQEKPQEHAHSTEHVCLTVAQAREIIALHKLAEPFRVTTFVAHHFQAQTLRVKLCRRKDEFVYEISLLQKDGRVIRVYVNPVTGKIVRTVNTEGANAATERQEPPHSRGRVR